MDWAGAQLARMTCLDTIVEAGDRLPILWLDLDLNICAAVLWAFCEGRNGPGCILNVGITVSAIGSKQVLDQRGLSDAALAHLHK